MVGTSGMPPTTNALPEGADSVEIHHSADPRKIWQRMETCILVTRFTADRRGTAASLAIALMRGCPPALRRAQHESERARGARSEGAFENETKAGQTGDANSHGEDRARTCADDVKLTLMH